MTQVKSDLSKTVFKPDHTVGSALRTDSIGMEELKAEVEKEYEQSDSVEKVTTVTVNLESVILLENKLFRIMENVNGIRLPDQKKSNKIAKDAYMQMFNEIIELCEDFWYIVRVESMLFCHLPQQMFSQDNPEFVDPITKSFILTMITVSVLGFLISNQDF